MKRLIGELASLVAFFGGLGALVYGIELWSRPAAFIVGGAVAIALAVAFTLNSGREDE